MKDCRKLLKSFCRAILRSSIGTDLSERCEEILWRSACTRDNVAYDRVFLKIVPRNDEYSYALLDVDEYSWNLSICGKSLSRSDEFSKSVEEIARDVFGSEDEDEDLWTAMKSLRDFATKRSCSTSRSRRESSRG